MKINQNSLELKMARACMNLSDLRKKGFSPRTIARASKGEELTTKTVGRIARALGVDVEELLEQPRKEQEQ